MRLAVVYVGDEKCHALTLHSMASVARSHVCPLDFHLMQINYDTVIDPTFAECIKALGHRLFAKRVSFPAPEIGSRSGARTYSYITDTMFLKAAALTHLAPEYDYILYLDGDILAFGDLKVDKLAGFTELAAACVDQTVAAERSQLDTSAKYRHGTISSVPVFNSGLLLVNAAEWLRQNMQQRFADSLHHHQGGCPYVVDCEPNDQCALNMALAGKWRALDPALNVQKIAMHTRMWAEARVRHYAGRKKFLPLRLHLCDAREFALLSAVSREAGLPRPSAFHDGGLSYRLNGIRRRWDIERAERALAENL